MFEYALFLTKRAISKSLRAILKFLCSFIPFSKTRKKVRNACYKYLDKYLDKYFGDKIVTLDKVDLHLPHEVLAQINAHTNEYFIAKNRIIPINATIKGGGGIA